MPTFNIKCPPKYIYPDWQANYWTNLGFEKSYDRLGTPAQTIPLSAHLAEYVQSKPEFFKLFPFHKFSEGTTEQERPIKETHFISKYKPKLNR